MLSVTIFLITFFNHHFGVAILSQFSAAHLTFANLTLRPMATSLPFNLAGFPLNLRERQAGDRSLSNCHSLLKASNPVMAVVLEQVPRSPRATTGTEPN
jgi:hypothetical protein